MTIPKGATHFSDTYDIIQFWKVGDDYYSREGERWYSCWFYWNNDKWVKDKAASSRRFSPISEFMTETP